MRPRASTLRTPAWLATPSGPTQSAPRHLRWVTSEEHTPGVFRKRLSVLAGPSAPWSDGAPTRLAPPLLLVRADGRDQPQLRLPLRGRLPAALRKSSSPQPAA